MSSGAVTRFSLTSDLDLASAVWLKDRPDNNKKILIFNISLVMYWVHNYIVEFMKTWCYQSID